MNNEYNFPKIAMEIIMYAGDARNKAFEAIDSIINEDDIIKAEELLKDAKECVKKAHKVQTDVMQSLARDEYEGKEQDFCLPMLFIHAQDTIMTIMSEVNIIEKMILIYKKRK